MSDRSLENDFPSAPDGGNVGERHVVDPPLLRDTANRAIEFLREAPERPVAPNVDADTLRQALAGPTGSLPEEGRPAARVLAELDAATRPGLVTTIGPRFFGFVIGGVHPVALATDWLVSTWDANLGLHVLSPSVAIAEEIAGRWLLEALRLPAHASVGFVTGGQMANFTGLAAARFEILRRVGWDVNARGLAGAPPIAVVGSDEAHVTIHRALRYLGIGTDAYRPVPTDDQGRMIPERLDDVLRTTEGPTIVCAQAGDVNSGAFDRFEEIEPRAHAHGAWVHVDGAFGLWAAATERYRPLTRGVERADSWAVDAHKWLNVPQDCGVAIVAHPGAHRGAVSTSTAYLIKSDGAERDPVDWTPEFSRRARSLPVYATMRHLGRRGIEDLVNRCCALTRRMVERLSASPHVEILADVVLNQALVRFHPARAGGPDDDRDPAARAAADALTRAVILRVQRDGTCWLGGTDWKGRAAMRVSIINGSTTEPDIDRSAAAILRCLDAGLGSES